MHHRPLLRTTLVALAAAALPGLAAACSTCGCSLNSDWASQGYATSRGLHLSLREDYFNQSRLIQGSDRIAAGSVALPAEEELQRKTINRNTPIGADYSFDRRWGLSVQLPWLDRHHQTFPEGETTLSTSDGQGLGDVRVLARYQGFRPDASVGVQFGLKLPTGSFKQRFRAGTAAGELLDRGLQRGTGTTDALLGVYTFGNLGESLGYFSQAMAQVALNARDGFRPGNSLNVNLGLRYLDAGIVTPQLQLNLHGEQRESGAFADRANSGAVLAYLSPGLGLKLGRRLDAFVFVQLPVHEHVNGVQIEPGRLWSAGLQYRL
ncbi:hypothetical protein [Dyella sp.]|jgi:hypothetical protein|uniref:hypothetical protein n=1 Tax=Dyella sp. TaxID=1869338 RepID=UPI002D7715A1|nr:hypothetical protein [Dyella sp.]HET6431014.1 hypothetical protein [Dyella sp.]